MLILRERIELLVRPRIRCGRAIFVSMMMVPVAIVMMMMVTSHCRIEMKMGAPIVSGGLGAAV